MADAFQFPSIDLLRLTPAELSQLEHAAKVYGAAAALRRRELIYREAPGLANAADILANAVRTLRAKLPKRTRWKKL